MTSDREGRWWTSSLGWVSLAIALLSGFGSPIVSAQAEAAVSENEAGPPGSPEVLLLTMAPAKRQFEAEAPVELRVSLRNSGRVPVSVPEAFFDHVMLRLREQGKSWETCIEPAASSEEPIVARELEPEEGWTLSLDLSAACTVGSSGQYEVWLYYGMPPNLRGDGAVDPIYEGLWSGELAETVPFEILPARAAQ